ncbi:MAG TPA: hypothetical protein VHJ78_10160 [Actinomycetota bacterium]|nr:hypothetical protein [Actinomycetota bacterium]
MSSKRLTAGIRRLLAVLLAACLATLAACGGSGEKAADTETGGVEISRDPILLPDDARQIVEDLNEGSDKANASLDASLQDSIETSPARDIDDAFFKRSRAQGRTSVTGPVRNLQDVTTYVPRQTRYPARFLAFVKLGNPEAPGEPAAGRLRLYEKKAADEPWKLAMYITVAPEFPAPDVPLDENGFARMVTEEGVEDLKLEPARVADQYADYLSGYAAGVESSIFAPGRHTTETAVAYKAQVDRDAQAGINSSIKVTANRYPIQTFQLRDGRALAIFAENIVTTYLAAPGKALNPLSGSEGLLEPGSYSTIERHNINMVAAVIPPADSNELVQVVGSTGGTVSFDASNPPAASPTGPGASPTGSPTPSPRPTST